MHGNRQRQVLNLYRSLLRAGRAYPDYNIRDYVVRHVRQDFRLNASISGTVLTDALAFGTSQLSLIGRQATIASLFPHENSVMESPPSGTSASSSAASSLGVGSLAASGAAPVGQEVEGEDDDESMIVAPRDKA